MNNLFYHITISLDENLAHIRWHSSSPDSFLILNNDIIYYPTIHQFDTKDIPQTKKATSFFEVTRYVCDVTIETTKDASYSFIIKCNNEASNSYSFNTLGKNKPFNFYALTDLQPKYNENIKKLINLLNERYQTKSFVLCSGDITDCAASEEEWSFVLDNELFCDAPFMSAVGDHEYWGDDIGHPYPMYDKPYTYNEIFNNAKNGVINNTNYYFTYGNSLFVFFDTADSNHASGKEFDEQAKWFKDKIIPLRSKYKNLFVIMHKSIHGSKIIDSVVWKYLNPTFEKLFIDAKVNLVLSGHDHIYSRTNKINGVTYLDMGSSGTKRRNIDESLNDMKYAKTIDLREENFSCAANIQVLEDKTIVEVINTNNEIIDKFTI